MAFSNAFLVAFGKKEKGKNKNKETKALSTLHHRKHEDAQCRG